MLGSLITSITYRVTTKINDFISMVFKLFYVNVKKLVRSSNGVARGNGFFAFDNFFNLFQQCPEETNFRLYYPRVNFNVWRLSSYHRLTLKHFTDYFTNQYLSIHGRPSWADFNTLINDLTQRSKCILVALKV